MHSTFHLIHKWLQFYEDDDLLLDIYFIIYAAIFSFKKEVEIADLGIKDMRTTFSKIIQQRCAQRIHRKSRSNRSKPTNPKLAKNIASRLICHKTETTPYPPVNYQGHEA
jgi:hypothetical protein